MSHYRTIWTIVPLIFSRETLKFFKKCFLKNTCEQLLLYWLSYPDNTLTGYEYYQLSWDVSWSSQRGLHWERHLRNHPETSQKRWFFCDIFKASQTNLKNDVSSIPQKRCLFRDISGTSQKHLLQVFLIFQEYRTKMVSCNIRRIITICDKIDVRPLETIKRAVHQFQ